MAGRTESETGSTTSQPVIDPTTIIKQVRCKCHARLFDARVHWLEVSMRDAWVIVKCWRCNKLVGFKPEEVTL